MKKRLYPKRLYIELNNQQLSLGLLYAQRSELFITSYMSIPLLNSEVVHGVICNPSYIYKEVCLYLKEQNLKNPKALICIPILDHNTGAKNSGNTLQAALCFSKTPIKIEKIITESLLINNDVMNNHVTNHQEALTNPKTPLKLAYSAKDLKNFTNYLTQFRPPYSLKLAHWFLISSIIVSGLGFGLTKIYALTIKKTHSIQTKNSVLGNKLHVLKKKTEAYRTLQDHTNTLASKITCMTHLTESKHDPATILSVIGEKIPHTCWLTGVKIHTSKQPKNRVQKSAQKQDQKQALTITIQGTTPFLNDTTRFIHDLGSSPIFKNLTLVNVKKLKTGSKSKKFPKPKLYSLYAFTISAVIHGG